MLIFALITCKESKRYILEFLDYKKKVKKKKK